MRDVLRAVFLYFLCLGWQDLRANCTKLKLLGKKKKTVVSVLSLMAFKNCI